MKKKLGVFSIHLKSEIEKQQKSRRKIEKNKKILNSSENKLTAMASKVEDPWIPLKDLAAIVEAAVLKGQAGILTDLEAVLKKHKPTFIGLLKNPPRSSADAALVRKAATEGLVLNDPEAKQKLPAAMVKFLSFPLKFVKLQHS